MLVHIKFISHRIGRYDAFQTHVSMRKCASDRLNESHFQYVTIACNLDTTFV